MKISFVIVIYHSEKEILNCLDSFSRHENHLNYEIILVDNHPDSKFNPKKLRGFEFDISYYSTPKNAGFGYGNNFGVRKSKYDILFFLNPDTIITTGITERTIEMFIANESKNYVLGYKLVDEQLKPNNTIGVFPEKNILSTFIIHSLFKKDPRLLNCKILMNQIWPWGAAFSIRKDLFLNAGGFDEKIFLCNEEPDLMRRLKNRKVIIMDIPIIHLEGHGEPNSINRHYEYFKSLFYYFEKHGFSKSYFKLNFRILYIVKNLLGKIDLDTINKSKALIKFLK